MWLASVEKNKQTKNQLSNRKVLSENFREIETYISAALEATLPIN